MGRWAERAPERLPAVALPPRPAPPSAQMPRAPARRFSAGPARPSLHPATVHRNSLPDLRASFVHPGEAASPLGGTQLMDEIAKGLAKCHKRCKRTELKRLPPVPVPMPKPGLLPPLFGPGKHARLVEERMEELHIQRERCAEARARADLERAKEGSRYVPSPELVPLLRLPKSKPVPQTSYHDQQVVDTRKLAGLQRAREYYRAGRPSDAELAYELQQTDQTRKRRWIARVCTVLACQAFENRLGEVAGGRNLDRSLACGRQVALFARCARFLGKLMRGVARKRAAAATVAAVLRWSHMAHARREMLRAFQRLLAGVRRIQRAWRFLRWRHRLRMAHLQQQLLLVRADAAMVPVLERQRAVAVWYRDRLRKHRQACAAAVAEHAIARAEDEALALFDSGMVARTSTSSLPAFVTDTSDFPELLRRARAGEFRTRGPKRRSEVGRTCTARRTHLPAP